MTFYIQTENCVGHGDPYLGCMVCFSLNYACIKFVDWFVTRYLVGQDSGYPAVNFDAWNLNAAVNTHVNVQANHAS